MMKILDGFGNKNFHLKIQTSTGCTEESEEQPRPSLQNKWKLETG